MDNDNHPQIGRKLRWAAAAVAAAAAGSAVLGKPLVVGTIGALALALWAVGALADGRTLPRRRQLLLAAAAVETALALAAVLLGATWQLLWGLPIAVLLLVSHAAGGATAPSDVQPDAALLKLLAEMREVTLMVIPAAGGLPCAQVKDRYTLIGATKDGGELNASVRDLALQLAKARKAEPGVTAMLVTGHVRHPQPADGQPDIVLCPKNKLRDQLLRPRGSGWK